MCAFDAAAAYGPQRAVDGAGVDGNGKDESPLSLPASANAAADVVEEGAFEKAVVAVLGGPALALDPALCAPPLATLKPVEDGDSDCFQLEGFTGVAVAVAVARARAAVAAAEGPEAACALQPLFLLVHSDPLHESNDLYNSKPRAQEGFRARKPTSPDRPVAYTSADEQEPTVPSEQDSW